MKGTSQRQLGLRLRLRASGMVFRHRHLPKYYYKKAAVRALHVPCTRRDPRSLNVPIVVYHNGLRYPVIEPFFPSFELVALHKAKMQVGQQKFVIYYRRDNIMEVNQTTSASFGGIQWRGDFLILQIDDGERPMNISGWSDRRAAVRALIKFVTPYNSDYCSKDGACVSLLQSALPISEHHLLQETDNLMNMTISDIYGIVSGLLGNVVVYFWGDFTMRDLLLGVFLMFWFSLNPIIK